MLNPTSFANSLAVVSGLFYLLILGLQAMLPNLFELVMDSWTFGAQVVDSVPTETGTVIGVLLTLMVTVWIFGYVWAWFYNKLA